MMDTKAHAPTGNRPTGPSPAAKGAAPRPTDDGEPKPKSARGEPGWFVRNAAVLAAWAQAMGGVLAIVAAFVIGGLNEDAARRVAADERQAQGDILAYAVRYELVALKRSFDRLAEAQQSLNSAPDRLLQLAMYVPPELAEARERFHLLGRDEGMAVQKALSDAQRVAFLLDFIRKDAQSYAAYYAKRGISNDSGAGTALYFNAQHFDAAVYSLSASLGNALRLMKVSERDLM